MGLTLFADASFCAQTGAAGWGAWAKADGWPEGKTFGGQFRKRQTSNNTAELSACANALHVVLNHEDTSGVRQILLQSDNQRALALLIGAGLAEASGWCPAKKKIGAGSGMTPGPDEVVALGIVKDVLPDKTKLHVRYVPGHRPGGGRAWVNRACDMLAKQHMRAMRKSMVMGKEQ